MFRKCAAFWLFLKFFCVNYFIQFPLLIPGFLVRCLKHKG